MPVARRRGLDPDASAADGTTIDADEPAERSIFCGERTLALCDPNLGESRLPPAKALGDARPPSAMGASFGEPEPPPRCLGDDAPRRSVFAAPNLGDERPRPPGSAAAPAAPRRSRKESGGGGAAMAGAEAALVRSVLGLRSLKQSAAAKAAAESSDFFGNRWSVQSLWTLSAIRGECEGVHGAVPARGLAGPPGLTGGERAVRLELRAQEQYSEIFRWHALHN